MRVYGLRGFFPPVLASRLTRAVLIAVSFFSCVLVAAQTGDTAPRYYAMTPAKILLWPNGAHAPFVLAEFSQDQWRFYQNDQEVTIEGTLKSRFKVAKKNQPQFNFSEIPNAESLQLWQPDAQVIVVSRSATTRIAVIAGKQIAVDDIPPGTEASNLTITPALRLLEDAVGNGGMSAWSQRDSQNHESWLDTLRQSPPLDVRAFQRSGEWHWVLQQKLGEDDLDRLTGGLEVQPSTFLPASAAPPAKEDSLWWVIFLLVLLLLAQMTSLILVPGYHWLQKQRRDKPPGIVAGYGGRKSSRPDGSEVMKPILEILQELIAGIEAQLQRGRGELNELEEAACKWASGQYREQLEMMLEGSADFSEVYARIRARFLSETFGTDDPAQLQDRVQIGRGAEEALDRIKASNFQSADLSQLPRDPNLLAELPGYLRRADQKLTKLRDEINEYKNKIAEGETMVSSARKLKADLDQRNETITAQKEEISSQKEMIRKLKESRAKLETEYHQLEDMVQRATQLDEVAKAWAKGKRSFLEKTGKPQAAAALAFLVDYSFFNLVEAVLQRDSNREAVMRDNLIRISEHATAQQFSGFDSRSLASKDPTPDSLPLVTNDRNLDREFFGYMMKMLREFGNLHIDFDFHLDGEGVHRVA